jgi:ADP-ribose pyrophosphatase YjhB (NUDIX family)
MRPLELNFCPCCGTPLQDRFIFERTRRACPACSFVFFREPKLAAGALVEQAGKVLLVRRAIIPKQGYWCLPAGYVEYDEGPVAAAIREVREETGLVIRVTGLEGVYHVRADPRGLGVMILYHARVTGGELCTGDDASAAAFFGPNDLPREIAFASTRRALRHWQRRLAKSPRFT